MLKSKNKVSGSKLKVRKRYRAGDGVRELQEWLDGKPTTMHPFIIDRLKSTASARDLQAWVDGRPSTMHLFKVKR